MPDQSNLQKVTGLFNQTTSQTPEQYKDVASQMWPTSDQQVPPASPTVVPTAQPQTAAPQEQPTQTPQDILSKASRYSPAGAAPLTNAVTQGQIEPEEGSKLAGMNWAAKMIPGSAAYMEKTQPELWAKAKEAEAAHPGMSLIDTGVTSALKLALAKGLPIEKLIPGAGAIPVIARSALMNSPWALETFINSYSQDGNINKALKESLGQELTGTALTAGTEMAGQAIQSSTKLAPKVKSLLNRASAPLIFGASGPIRDIIGKRPVDWKNAAVNTGLGLMLTSRGGGEGKGGEDESLIRKSLRKITGSREAAKVITNEMSGGGKEGQESADDIINKPVSVKLGEEAKETTVQKLGKILEQKTGYTPKDLLRLGVDISPAINAQVVGGIRNTQFTAPPPKDNNGSDIPIDDPRHPYQQATIDAAQKLYKQAGPQWSWRGFDSETGNPNTEGFLQAAKRQTGGSFDIVNPETAKLFYPRDTAKQHLFTGAAQFGSTVSKQDVLTAIDNQGLKSSVRNIYKLFGNQDALKAEQTTKNVEDALKGLVSNEEIKNKIDPKAMAQYMLDWKRETNDPEKRWNLFTDYLQNTLHVPIKEIYKMGAMR